MSVITRPIQYFQSVKTVLGIKPYLPPQSGRGQAYKPYENKYSRLAGFEYIQEKQSRLTHFPLVFLSFILFS